MRLPGREGRSRTPYRKDEAVKVRSLGEATQQPLAATRAAQTSSISRAGVTYSPRVAVLIGDLYRWILFWRTSGGLVPGPGLQMLAREL
jgi:hypothetical protein